ncbi:hypothetical protein N7448_000884 [Penicillium atrosanguineum]|uniref:Uncharacterized protein n=1 Tax=Penicillium atrosanguineum TaxID=1132637 RepID=A0A9W9HIG1_9EURO|nr:uncharacterized protein N7443_004278 [Penicillium atrosanguineum]KAJ5134095.1 hypothetical protein N7526_005460 [Penicillium atrosanguineum]KAJ5149306.1 hypothetical protein N7448_000884 [Penicillium atrosanguineum]KAJ5304618.1 hypothetical protein N7443_004278 [Penicillium atrosanguineum]KAJ5324086.1 hypothetical protein N7476_002686 [Penicillium atrosanguineum]
MTQSSSFETSDSFEKLYSYSFHTDSEFANGLAIILGHPGTPATQEEMNREDDLVIQAKCFFFSRKENLNPPIDFAAYKSWSLARSTGEQIATPDSSLRPGELESSVEVHVPDTETETPPEPAYPSSFAHIVELITTGQPIPGIEQIPDTVLTGHDTASEKPRRLKPWERDATELSLGEPSNEAV